MAELYERTFDLEDIEIQRGGDGRTVTAYAAVFGQRAKIRDVHGKYNEEIHRSSFARTLKNGPINRIGVFYNHGYDLTGKPNMVGSVPIGTPLEVRPDGRGLLTVTRYNKSPLAEQVLEAIRDGQIRGQSFRGRIYKSDESIGSDGEKLVIRTELGLTEYGPTHSPAYEGAGILAVRSADDLEDMIRTMIAEQTGTVSAPAGYQATAPAPGPADSADSHSRKTQARLIAMRARALNLGVISGQAPHQ